MEALKDHTGKPSIKRKLAYRSFLFAQFMAIAVMVGYLISIFIGNDFKLPNEIMAIFWSFLGSSLTFSGFNIPEYFSKLTK